MSTNINLLRGKIVAAGMTEGKLASEISMSQSTFSRKMQSDGMKFTIGEMHNIATVLQLTGEEAREFFLN